jgi:hypothetical protein
MAFYDYLFDCACLCLLVVVDLFEYLSCEPLVSLCVQFSLPLSSCVYTRAGVRVCFEMDFLVLDYKARRGKLPKFVSEVNVAAGVISREEEAFPRLDEAGIIWFVNSVPSSMLLCQLFATSWGVSIFIPLHPFGWVC